MKLQPTLEQVQSEPKVDLHNHLDGALSPESIWNVAQKQGITIPDLPEQTLDALKQTYPNPGPFGAGSKPEEFNRFLRMFNQALSIMQTPETIHSATLEVIRDLQKEGIIYAELRFAPNYHLQEGYSMEEIVSGVLKAMEAGRKETGVVTKLIIVIPREIAYTEEYEGPSAEDIVRTALEFQNQGVVAIDLACSEHFGPEAYIDAYKMTFGERLQRTVHAGEAGEQKKDNILTALKDMRVHGVGHALPLSKMNGAMEQIIKNGIRIEREPISNTCMCVGDGDFDEIDKLIDAGVLVSVNSDDPGVFGETCSLSNNLLAVARRFELGLEGIRRLTLNAVNSAFISTDEREELRTKITA